MRSFLIAGNWKMNGDSAQNRELVSGISAGHEPAEGVDVLVCPPFPYIAPVVGLVADAGISVGAQTLSENSNGAFTGEVSASMLRDLGATFVIVGHSERRTLYAETDDAVAAKFQAAQAAGIVPILCVGETLEEREAGETEAVIGRQLAAIVNAAGVGALANAVIAYEPVWAIGTGMTATPEQAQDVHKHIRSLLAKDDEQVADGVQILYGGSMKGENAAGLLGMPDIDGGLIGGASLKAEDFLAIVRAAAAVRKQ